MNLYHILCDLKPGVGDGRYRGHLKEQGLTQGYRLTRRKPGLGRPAPGEFHIMIEAHDLTAFDHVAGRREPVEGFHFGVGSLVSNATFAL